MSGRCGNCGEMMCDCGPQDDINVVRAELTAKDGQIGNLLDTIRAIGVALGYDDPMADGSKPWPNELISEKILALRAELAAANERLAEMAAALDATEAAFEKYAEHHGPCCEEHNSTDETAPGECALCDIDRAARRYSDHPSALLAAVRRQAKSEGAAEALDGLAAKCREKIAELRNEYMGGGVERLIAQLVLLASEYEIAAAAKRREAKG